MPKKRGERLRHTGHSRPMMIVPIIASIVLVVAFFLFDPSFLLRKDRLTVVWATEPVWVTTIDSSDGSIVNIRIPSDAYVSAPYGLGQYRIGVLWRLGKIEKKSGAVLAGAVKTFLGAPVDGWIGKENDTPKIDESGLRLVEMLKQTFFTPRSFFQNSPTNLSPLQRLYLWWHLGHARAASVVTVDLRSEQVFTPIGLADDTEAVIGDIALVDKVSQRLFRESSIEDNSIVFRVYNSSKAIGLGNNVARILTNIGLHVISVGNGEAKKACSISAPAKWMKDKSIMRVASLFHCTVDAHGANGNWEVGIYVGSDVADHDYL